ncbi:hypothetical protein IWQ55_001837 [Labrenzia sp. EL_208]|nr:hypothetical protein [Labrenzia sp. EL_162]MBG6162367.1 hypothetical protein [Labrenzia sp. EL_195]MBG6173912.1 hypothetical protein [Labrenzia sp. EL_132]MBG6192763.1 hypothetical protein [Labrenzia sp. EL_159]MBG6228632.1 hypothetical protein [Labrenzia sp. EL_208]
MQTGRNNVQALEHLFGFRSFRHKKGPQVCDPKLITVHVAPSTTTNALGQIRLRCITQKGD